MEMYHVIFQQIAGDVKPPYVPRVSHQVTHSIPYDAYDKPTMKNCW